MELMNLKVEDRLELIELLENLNEIYYSGEIWNCEEWDVNRYLTLKDKWELIIFTFYFQKRKLFYKLILFYLLF